jgi:16S rRNA (guanine(966)-N(2))-methyltransferase RsmD
MRVIAGSARGVRLAPVPDGTRPLADRAREGLFSSLGEAVAGAAVLDLFAGTGAVGIEALSRGAARAVFVDSSLDAVRSIRENLERTKLSERAGVVRRDVARALRSDLGRFDLIFLDPPYALEGAALEGVLAELAAQGVVAPGGLVVLTREIKSSMPVIPLDWASDRRLSYGDAAVLVYRA